MIVIKYLIFKGGGELDGTKHTESFKKEIKLR